MLTRLYDYNVTHLGLDHSNEYQDGIVDVFLTYGGQAGGEQAFEIDPQLPRSPKVNSIYIYDLKSFVNPVEMAREVGHEYGHATLPPVGGFQTPEDWGNGYLGERIYLDVLAKALRAGTVDPDDAMGATAEQLEQWVHDNVRPLVRRTALHGVDGKRLAGTGPAALDAYMELALYTRALLPESVFRRSMALSSVHAADYEAAVVTAAAEPEKFTVTIPDYLSGSAIWLPIGRAKFTGGKELDRRGDWVKVQPTGLIEVTPVPIKN